MRNTKQCAIYIRALSQTESRGSASRDLQERACREAATNMEYEVAGVYYDDEFAAIRGNPRPAYEDMMGRSQEFDSVFVWDRGQLGREALEEYETVSAILGAEVGLHFVLEHVSFLWPGEWQALRRDCALHESDLRRREEEAQRSIKKVGQAYSTQVLTFGYRLSEETGLWVPDPEYAPVVQRIYERFAAGETAVGLCRWLQVAGVLPPVDGAIWTTSQLYAILQCEAYLGTVMRMPPWSQNRGHCEAIVDAELWEACQRVIKANGALFPRQWNGKSLTPILRCGYCGERLGASSPKRGGMRYRCTGQVYVAAENRHPAISVPDALIQEHLWKLIDGFAASGNETA